MNTKDKILNILNDNDKKYISGVAIANKLGVSRNAVSKAIDSLKKEGYEIEAKHNKGYCLSGCNIINKSIILEYLERDLDDLEVLDSITSTNDYLKELSVTNKYERKVVIAREQLAGRGRREKMFASPRDKGLYISYLQKMENIKDITTLVMDVVIVIIDVLEEQFEIELAVKWVNDIFFNNKKLAGILCEGSLNLEEGRLENVIIGMGLNVYEDNSREELFPGVATSLEDIFNKGENARLAGKEININKLAAKIIDGLTNYFDLQLVNESMEDKEKNKKEYFKRYREKCFIIGKEVLLKRDKDDIPIKVIDVLEDGSLKIENKSGDIENLKSGDISLQMN